MEEPSYAALQREVQRKLGRCLIRLQQYEILLKEIVAKREASGEMGNMHAQLAENASAAATKTMGLLVGELTEKYFQPTLLESDHVESGESPDNDEQPVGWARLQISVSMPPDAHAQLKAELRELVDMRNDLVHHFVEGQDLISEEGCIAADMYLQDCYAEIDRHLTSLRNWASSMNEAKRAMLSLMASSEYKEFLIAELSPTTARREAALPALVELLQRAAVEHSKGGWTPLNAAIAFIRNVAPEQTPKKHSFGSWRQVLHEARIFEVRRDRTEGSEMTESWYRFRS